MVRALIVLHRWLGIAFCLLFAMWFATGIVMHFVPFPALTEAERVGGLSPIDVARVLRSPADAVTASGLAGVERVRLLQRRDGPVYIVTAPANVRVLQATDLSDARVAAVPLAVAIAEDYARRRGFDIARAHFAELARYDQWTVPNDLDPHRPLYRIALDDDAGTELYVSSATGEVVRDTTRRERWWNYAGSVTHWIYPTALRRNWVAWDRVVWWLSLVALVGAVSGAVLGLMRLKIERRRVRSPYRGWHAWHHWLGLACMTFVLTWIFSGWLSMDHARLFSSGQIDFVLATRDWPAAQSALSEVKRIPAAATEVEWFTLGGRLYRRDRLGIDTQRLAEAGSDATSASERDVLTPAQAAAASGAMSGCEPPLVISVADNYPAAATMPGAPVYRIVCGDIWLHVDAASGLILERLDRSRRAYRWAYQALHTFDLPWLVARPNLRTLLVVMLCGAGVVFSMTGVVIGWRRLRLYAAGS